MGRNECYFTSHMKPREQRRGEKESGDISVNLTLSPLSPPIWRCAMGWRVKGRGSILDRDRTFFILFHSVHSGSAVHPDFCPMGSGGIHARS
jgi:hypothetical protein